MCCWWLVSFFHKVFITCGCLYNYSYITYKIYRSLLLHLHVIFDPTWNAVPYIHLLCYHIIYFYVVFIASNCIFFFYWLIFEISASDLSIDHPILSIVITPTSLFPFILKYNLHLIYCPLEKQFPLIHKASCKDFLHRIINIRRLWPLAININTLTPVIAYNKIYYKFMRYKLNRLFFYHPAECTSLKLRNERLPL